MARPQKEGLDYFPVDVDIDQDDKVALIEAQHGIVGFAIIIKLLMKIYKNGYFYEWTEKEQLLFSKRVNVNINEVNVIINDCIKWGLFDSEMLEKHKVLTSKGIQRRYLEATNRRQSVSILTKYLLLPKDSVNAYRNLVIDDNNSNLETISEDINPQSKVKESKVKKSIIMSPEQSKFIDILKQIKYYPLDIEKDIEMFERLTSRYPTVDPIAAIDDYALYKLDHPLDKKSNPRSQINTAFQKCVEWKKCLKKTGQDQERTEEEPKVKVRR